MTSKRAAILNSPLLLRIEVAPEARFVMLRAGGLAIVFVLFPLLGLLISLLRSFSLGDTIVLICIVSLPAGIIVGIVALAVPRPLVITQRGVTWGLVPGFSYYWREVVEYSLGDSSSGRPVFPVMSPTLMLLTNDWKTLYMPVSPRGIRLTLEQKERLRAIFAQRGIQERSSY
jgi:hypothetical protein